MPDNVIPINSTRASNSNSEASVTNTPAPTPDKQRRKSRTISKAKLVTTKKTSRYTPGTLAYVFDLQSMSHESVYAFLHHLIEEDPRVQALVQEYDSLTEKEKAKPMIWDILAHKHLIPVAKLYGKLAEAALRMNRSMSYQVLARNEPEVIEKLSKSAKKEKNLDHTRLFLETSGAIGNKSAASIQVNLNQQNNDNRTQQIFGLPSLDTTLRDPVKQVREAQQKMLEVPRTEFIDTTSIINEQGEKEEVYVEANKRT